MCGIAGYFGTREIDQSNIKKCFELMKRRGPDNKGYQYFKKNGKNVYLLHTRLSIIDLDERSNQPFNIESKWIIFNGELYNYKELRSGLQKKGLSFRTESDTEVLLRTINHFGTKGLDKCEGMWAFAVYDEHNGSLILSRDRFGEKPLYIYQDETGIYFGSETKFIFELLGKKLPINFNHLYRYLVNGYKSLYKYKETFFIGLEELEPYHVLTIDNKGIQKKFSYWQPRFEPNETMSYEEAVKGVRERLIKSVELRIRADVPLAFCMSGGIDSNSLISIAKNVFNYDVHGFTIVNTDERYEENDMVQHAVEKLDIKHTAIPLNTKGFIKNLKELIKYHDSPICTITYYTHWLLIKSIAEQGYKISISGTAADELFTGYYDHHLQYLYEVRNNSYLHSSYLNAWTKHVKPIVRNPYLSDPDLFVKDKNFRDHIFLDAREFSRYLKKPWFEKFQETKFTDSLLRNRMLNEMFHEAVPPILHEDDLNSMYFSVENRSPYLDRDLFEFSYKIPSRFLMCDGFNKVILRDAMRGIVPDKIIDNRRKVGFNAPILDLLDTNNSEVVDYLLDDSPIFDHIKKDMIKELIKKSQLPNSQSKFLFYFLNSKMFVEEFL